MNPSLQSDSNAEFDELLRFAVRRALEGSDFLAAFADYRKLLPMVAPGFFAQIPPVEDAQRAISFAMFRQVWNRVPRPDHDWRPQPLPKPERNAPCPCGSGRKYKQCCGPLAGNTPFDDEKLSLLSYVLERVPVSQFKDLPFKKLSPEELGHVAEQWLEQRRAKEVLALLEPLLADPAKLDARHEYAFDMLCDAYLELDHPQKRQRLAESVMQTADRTLKAAAMHRRCTMHADRGEYPAAWKLFKEAQRIDPDNPSLAHLEVIMLMSQGEIAQAQERARFWAARLRKLGYDGERIVEMMDDIARDPNKFAEAFNRGTLDDLDEGDESDGSEDFDPQALRQLIALGTSLPAPACHYRLQAHEGNAGPLEVDAALAAIEGEWRGVFLAANEPFADPGNPWADTAWLDWLAGHPLAWQSFSVLDDLLLALDESYADDEETDIQVDAFEAILLDRAVALLRLAIAENHAEGCKLEWGWLQNRPALRLLGRSIDLAAGSDEELLLLEWLLLTLNPNDNQGMRERLVHVYCANNRAADALEIFERYPGDGLGAMRYGRVLALHLAGKRGDAIAALAEAKKHSPRILKTLTAAKPRIPELQPGLMTHGGEDEAWYYRISWRALWDKTGALAWLKQAAGVKG